MSSIEARYELRQKPDTCEAADYNKILNKVQIDLFPFACHQKTVVSSLIKSKSAELDFGPLMTVDVTRLPCPGDQLTALFQAVISLTFLKTRKNKDPAKQFLELLINFNECPHLSESTRSTINTDFGDHVEVFQTPEEGLKTETVPGASATNTTISDVMVPRCTCPCTCDGATIDDSGGNGLVDNTVADETDVRTSNSDCLTPLLNSSAKGEANNHSVIELRQVGMGIASQPETSPYKTGDAKTNTESGGSDTSFNFSGEKAFSKGQLTVLSLYLFLVFVAPALFFIYPLNQNGNMRPQVRAGGCDCSKALVAKLGKEVKETTLHEYEKPSESHYFWDSFQRCVKNKSTLILFICDISSSACSGKSSVHIADEHTCEVFVNQALPDDPNEDNIFTVSEATHIIINGTGDGDSFVKHFLNAWTFPKIRELIFRQFSIKDPDFSGIVGFLERHEDTVAGVKFIKCTYCHNCDPYMIMGYFEEPFSVSESED